MLAQAGPDHGTARFPMSQNQGSSQRDNGSDKRHDRKSRTALPSRRRKSEHVGSKRRDSAGMYREEIMPRYLRHQLLESTYTERDSDEAITSRYCNYPVNFSVLTRVRDHQKVNERFSLTLSRERVCRPYPPQVREGGGTPGRHKHLSTKGDPKFTWPTNSQKCVKSTFQYVMSFVCETEKGEMKVFLYRYMVWESAPLTFSMALSK